MTLAATPIPFIDVHHTLVFLLQVALLLGAAVLLGRLAQRVGLPPVVGELSAGILLGPSVLGHAAPRVSAWLLPHDANQMHMLDATAQLGVLLLIGITGMSMDPGLLRRRAGTAARVSAGGLLMPLAVGVAIGFALPATMLGHGTSRTVFAFFLGVVMCVSAIPVIAKTLLDMRLLHRDVGQLIIAGAAIDDVVGWVLLSVVGAMATTGVSPAEVTSSVAKVLAVVAFAILIGRPVVTGVMRLSERAAQAYVTVAAAVVLVIAAAAGTGALNLETSLGALFAGMLIGSARRLDRARLLPLRALVLGVLAPLFFTTAGLRMDLAALGRPAVLGSAAAVLAVAIVGKFVGVYLGARLSRRSHREAIALGAGLNARGVIEVIIAMVGLRLGVLSGEAYTVVVLMAVVTSLMAPPILRYATRRMEMTEHEIAREKALA
jgi:Kef-type K+ transport system membrane component KefB